MRIEITTMKVNVQGEAIEHIDAYEIIRHSSNLSGWAIYPNHRERSEGQTKALIWR